MTSPDQYAQKRRAQILDDEPLNTNGFGAHEHEETWRHDDSWIAGFIARLARMISDLGHRN
jgi:hypothetical protein